VILKISNIYNDLDKKTAGNMVEFFSLSDYFLMGQKKILKELEYIEYK